MELATTGNDRLAVGGSEPAVFAATGAMNGPFGIGRVLVGLLGVVHAVAGESARDKLGLPVVENGGVALQIEGFAARADTDHGAGGPVRVVADRRPVADDWVPVRGAHWFQPSLRMRVLSVLGERPKCSAVCLVLRHSSQ